MAQSVKRPVESFLVALAAQTTMPTSGTISDSTNLDVNLANGQLGIASSSVLGSVAMNTFLGATPTMAQAPVIQIYQGTSDSTLTSTLNATHPLGLRPYEVSSVIDGRHPVTVTKQLYVAPESDVVQVGAVVGDAAAVNILDETEYEIAIGFRGRRIQETFSSEEAAYLRAKVTTPDFTTLGYTDAQATNWILTYLGWEINKNSKAFKTYPTRPNHAPVVAFLIDTAGASGVEIGQGSPIAAGDVVPVVTTASGNRNITLTADMATSIKDAAIAGFGDVIANVTWSIIPINLATAATASGDLLLIMALDSNLVYEDNIPQVKNYLEVSLPQGFNQATVTNTKQNIGTEGEGTYRQLNLLYKGTQGQRKYNLRHEMFPIPEYPSPFLSTETYNVYNILHSNYRETDVINTIGSPFRDIVCIPSSNTTLVTAFDAALNAWLGSTANQAAIVTVS